MWDGGSNPFYLRISVVLEATLAKCGTGFHSRPEWWFVGCSIPPWSAPQIDSRRGRVAMDTRALPWSACTACILLWLASGCLFGFRSGGLVGLHVLLAL